MIRDVRSIKIFLLISIFILISFLSIHPENSSKTEKTILRIRSLMESDPTDAGDLAKALLEYSLETNDIIAIQTARILIAEALYYQGKYKESTSSLQNILLNSISLKSKYENNSKQKTLKAEILYFTGLNLYKMNDYSFALKNFLRAFDAVKDYNILLKSKISVEITRTYLIMSNYKHALDFGLKSLDISRKSGDKLQSGVTQFLLGYIHRELKEYGKALKNFEAAKNISESLKNTKLKIQSLNEISNIFFYNKKYEKALAIKYDILSLARRTNDTYSMSFLINDIGMTYFAQKKFKKALKTLNKSYKLEKKINNSRGIIVSEINIAETLKKLNKFKEAEKYANRALNRAKKKNLPGEQLNSYEILSDLFFKSLRYKSAYNQLEKAYELSKKIFNIEKGRKIAELESNRKIMESENKILLLEKNNRVNELEIEKKNRFITLQKVITFSLIIFLTLVFIALRIIRKNNLKLKEANIKLDTLNNNLKTKSKELQDTLSQVQQLSGLLPICASCKKIRDDGGYWHQVEEYIRSHSEVSFSHSLCPVCQKKLYSGDKGEDGSKNIINPS